LLGDDLSSPRVKLQNFQRGRIDSQIVSFFKSFDPDDLEISGIVGMQANTLGLKLHYSIRNRSGTRMHQIAEICLPTSNEAYIALHDYALSTNFAIPAAKLTRRFIRQGAYELGYGRDYETSHAKEDISTPHGLADFLMQTVKLGAQDGFLMYELFRVLLATLTYLLGKNRPVSNAMVEIQTCAGVAAIQRIINLPKQAWTMCTPIKGALRVSIEVDEPPDLPVLPIKLDVLDHQYHSFLMTRLRYICDHKERKNVILCSDDTTMTLGIEYVMINLGLCSDLPFGNAICDELLLTLEEVFAIFTNGRAWSLQLDHKLADQSIRYKQAKFKVEPYFKCKILHGSSTDASGVHVRMLH
jgi:hypothetical protein